MKLNLHMFLFLLAIVSPTLTIEPANSQTKTITLDDVSHSVVFLQVPLNSQGAANNVSQKGIEIGTGFLVNLNGRLFLTTAAHLASHMSAASSVTFGTQNDALRTVAITELATAPGDPKWVFHPTADVATLYLNPKPELATILTPRALSPLLLISTLEAPARSRPLTVVGFPLGLGVVFSGPSARISPISRESKPVSGLITIPRADTKTLSDFYLLDSPSVGGFSGSPVFILPASFSEGDRIRFSTSTFCVGLIHGTFSDETGGKFAAVVPSAFITQVLETAYAEVLRNSK